MLGFCIRKFSQLQDQKQYFWSIVGNPWMWGADYALFFPFYIRDLSSWGGVKSYMQVSTAWGVGAPTPCCSSHLCTFDGDSSTLRMFPQDLGFTLYTNFFSSLCLRLIGLD